MQQVMPGNPHELGKIGRIPQGTLDRVQLLEIRQDPKWFVSFTRHVSTRDTWTSKTSDFGCLEVLHWVTEPRKTC